MSNELIDRLIDAAFAAQKRAYAPYSNFRVGAAVLDEKSRIFSGCNIENSSFGASVCAERTAIFTAVAAGAKEIKILAVITDDDDYARPCGICRQVAAEFAGPFFRLIALKPDRSYLEYSLEEILPFFFGPENLS